MTRQNLIKTISAAAAGLGYRFHTGFDYRINAEVKQLPAMWLMPPRLVKTDGRRQGVKHYDIDIRIIHSGAAHSPEEKEENLDRMEQAAFALCNELCRSQGVITVTRLKYSSEELSLTNRGELSLALKFTAQIPFCHKTNHTA